MSPEHGWAPAMGRRLRCEALAARKPRESAKNDHAVITKERLGATKRGSPAGAARGRTAACASPRLLSAVSLAPGHPRPARPRLIDRVWAFEPPTLLAAPLVLLGLLVLGTLLVFRAPGFGWDEAVYASKARSLVTDVPPSAWNLFRPPGLVWLGMLAAPFGFFDESVRMLSMALAVLGLGAYGWLGMLLGGRVVALAAVLVAITMPIVLTELQLFHNDLPSAGILFALMALLWHQLEVRPSPDWRLLLAPALAAAAFYMRFGTLPAVFAIGAGTLLLWGPALLRHWRLSLAALLVGVALALPHVLEAIRETGSPIGVLQLSVDKVNTSDPIAAARVYLRALNGIVAGPFAIGFLVAGGALGTFVGAQWIRRRASRALTRATAWLLVPAGLTSAVLVLVSHAEARYLLFPVLLASLAGSLGVARVLTGVITRRNPTDQRRPAGVALGALLVVVAGLTVRNLATPPRMAADQASWAAEAGAWIRGNSARPCLVVSTIYPILGWYAACSADELYDAPKALLPAGAPIGSTYIVFTTHDSFRRGAATIERYRAIASEALADIGTASKGAEVTLARP